MLGRNGRKDETLLLHRTVPPLAGPDGALKVQLTAEERSQLSALSTPGSVAGVQRVGGPAYRLLGE